MKLLLIGISFITLLSCSLNELSEQALKEYISDPKNGLQKTTLTSSLKVEVSYRPSTLVWINELRNLKDEAHVKRLELSYDSLNYFIIHFSRNGQEIENGFLSEAEEYSRLSNYLSFGISNNLRQIIGKDTADALDVINTRTYGASSSTAVMAVFAGNLRKEEHNVRLILNDDMLGLGLSEFEFDIRDIKNTPNLIIN